MGNYKLQSVLLNRNRFTHAQALKYLALHSLRILKVDMGPDWFHFRQESPQKLKKEGYTRFRVITIIPDEVEYIVAYKGNAVP